MTNQMFNPQPCYSGVTIQIANPMVNAGYPNVNQNAYPSVYPGYITAGTQQGCQNDNCRYINGYEVMSNPYTINTASSVYSGETRYNNDFKNNNSQFIRDNQIFENNETVRDIKYVRDARIHDGQNVNVKESQNIRNSQYNRDNQYSNATEVTNPIDNGNYPPAYPAQYYINNYGNGGVGVNGVSGINNNGVNDGGTYDSNVNYNRRSEESVNRRAEKSVDNSSDKSYRNTDNNYSNRVDNSSNVYDKEERSNKSYSSDSNNRYNNFSASENNQRVNKNSSYSENVSRNYTAEGPNEISHEYRSDDNIGHMNNYKIYADGYEQKPESDMQASQTIIEDLDQRVAEREEEKKNTKETKIVALTDEYIKSLENYLNNPNDEIRLMASKEILTRLDEDHDRYNDAALNALLNKMLQDPAKLIRIAALSAFASQLACGNNYTVQLLHNIQANPNADKEDILQAADILLKMSAGVEVKNIPNPSVKNNEQQETGK